MRVGLSFEFSRKLFQFGWNWEDFYWTPGEIESGSSSPGEYRGWSDRYVKYGWLGFIVFYLTWSE